jgi:hypothetical protein
LTVAAALGLELARGDDVDRHRHVGAARARIAVDHGARLADQRRLGQAPADRQALGEQEGVGDAAADDQPVDFFAQALQDEQLGRDLAAGDDRDQRPPRRAAPW